MSVRARVRKLGDRFFDAENLSVVLAICRFVDAEFTIFKKIPEALGPRGLFRSRDAKGMTSLHSFYSGVNALSTALANQVSLKVYIFLFRVLLLICHKR
jgi:hypothetical protein